MSDESKTTDGASSSRILNWIERRINLTELFSVLTIFGIFYTEIDTRKPLRAALREALQSPLPDYARWPRILGPISILVFSIQAVSGVLLAFYYQPVPEVAHDSVKFIVSEVPFGWFLHQVHSWGSTVLIVLLVLRIVRLAFDRFYRSPRELVWIAAIFLFLMAFHTDLTGRLLSWSQNAYWSTVRGIETITAVPIAGSVFSFLIGGTTIGEYTLTRFYILHLTVPVFMLVWFALSFGTVRRVGLSGGERESGANRSGAATADANDHRRAADRATAAPSSARRGYRAHLINLLIALLLIFGVVVTLAVLAPAPFESAADPLRTPPAVGPPWYLLASYAVLHAGPATVPLVVRGSLILLFVLALIGLPFFTRGPVRQGRRRIWGNVVISLVFLALVGLTLVGAAYEGWSP